MPRGGGNGSAAAFEARDPFFQNRDGGIVQTRIDVSEIVQVEERGGVVDIVKNIRGGLVDRCRAGTGHRVWRGAGMDGAGLEPVGHVV